jgi:hypothetical protein
MKFKNKTTGVILIPSSKEVIEQLQKNDDYELVVEKEPTKKTSKKEEIIEEVE